MSWTKTDRVQAVLHGELADRPPITCYHHFPQFEHGGARLMADTMLDFQKKWDWDFVKMNPRAVYYYEAWGNTYDYDHYKDVVPSPVTHLIHDWKDLDKVEELSGTEPIWQEQYETARLVVEGVKGEVPVFAGAFTPIGILLNLCGYRSIGRYREAPREDSDLIKLCHAHPAEVHRALKNIANTIAKYNSHMKEAGVTGIFYAALGMARTGYFTREEWEEFCKPYDLIAMEPIRDLPNIVHTCGIYGNPDRFLDYPCRVIHWAASAPGNPSMIGSSSWLKDKVAMGGCDERPFGNAGEEKIRHYCRVTIEGMKKQPFLMAPECSVSPKVSDSELRVFRESVEKIHA
jgi:uroporphyrinogen decarboxylase